MVNLLDYDLAGIKKFLIGIGEDPFRGTQLFKWVHQKGVADFEEMTNLSKSLRKVLSEVATVEVPMPKKDDIASDGTRKVLFGVDSQNAVESVFIPEIDRGTLCISSQVGCALACTFCSTGRQGFNRNLSVSEIVGQLWWFMHSPTLDGTPNRLGNVSADRPVSNVVMMGMGEPLTNYDSLITALRVMLDDNAYGLSRRKLTVSTSGIVPNIDRLREDCPVSLAVSLHAPTNELRDELVPINKKYPIEQLLDACRRYIDPNISSDVSSEKWIRSGSPRDFVTFEYVMLHGINDSNSQARELLKLTEGISCKFNLIPFNPFPGSGYKTSHSERVQAFQSILMSGGRIATVRKTRGDDVSGACGQLAGEVKDKRTPRRSRSQHEGVSSNRYVMRGKS